MKRPVLDVSGLTIGISGTPVVDGFDLSVGDHEIVALIGESGSGKSMAALAIAGLLPKAATLAGGTVWIDGEEMTALDKPDRARLRGEKLAMIFQEPVASLNPLMKVGDQVMERLIVHHGLSYGQARPRAIEMLAETGIHQPEMRIDQYPYELSGGMCQRVMIAMGLIANPRLLIADEPTTALDVTVQAQILELLVSLRDRKGTAILIITHDMGVVAEIADTMCVMYAGRIVEKGGVADVFRAPRHPYTRLLLATMPTLSQSRKTRLRIIEGNVPSLADWPEGCRFRPRCPLATDRCGAVPPLQETVVPGQSTACWNSDRIGDLQ